jgi:hypothetical protein
MNLQVIQWIVVLTITLFCFFIFVVGLKFISKVDNIRKELSDYINKK